LRHLPRRVPRHAAGARGGVRRRGHRALHRGADADHPSGPEGRARRLATRLPRAAQARAGPGRAPSPRLRDARRRQGHGRAGSRAPAHPAPRALGVEGLARAGRGGSPLAGPDAEGGARVTWRITRAALSTLSLVSCALVLAVLSGRAELILVSVPL